MTVNHGSTDYISSMNEMLKSYSQLIIRANDNSPVDLAITRGNCNEASELMIKALSHANKILAEEDKGESIYRVSQDFLNTELEMSEKLSRYLNADIAEDSFISSHFHKEMEDGASVILLALIIWIANPELSSRIANDELKRPLLIGSEKVMNFDDWSCLSKLIK